ncbi:hypothetical protein CFE70_000442 [Pyrenophora teres f. teres 0-1]|uniref:Uncharacterized protein n=2 Tax=Pyrenophora teres f. teres TaxID=97479 RepID=E3SA48_PYRTT|nr:hypothetical protein PTT_19964 [Pyrenophora teres f. teres 0-1]KAE8836294.1 hypothetical protein HRS9139_04392 [Pyrenophora teres f. teres]KAE8837735.1 hypothetical protein PTNB85_05070 [Pyrenophora teres f. teres]KAE8839845.1 hypothetical protein HRS9122_06450 [Pyrenophora teres f. teres]KAE8862558.1 hypothetical protein PTNB29_05120 [Pyrenophora teres f. teres]
MPKTKAIVISGPMDARHVGGVNVSGNSPSSLSHYFNNNMMIPDERPSHTVAAFAKADVPKRSDTMNSSILRPSLHFKGSFSMLGRQSSIRHTEETEKSDSESVHRPLRMKSSMSRLRQRVGLDRESYDITKTPSPEPPLKPEATQKMYAPLQDWNEPACLTALPVYTPVKDVRSSSTSASPLRKPLIQRRPSLPFKGQSLDVNARSAQPPARQHRADSGTAIDFEDVPVKERPVPFKEIMAVSSHAERMALYKKTRDYWATVDHGLAAWTEYAGRSRTVVMQ